MRFLHTSDWQLGLRRHLLSPEAQARYADARFEAVRRIGELARGEECELVVVAGDVFESSRVDLRTVVRGLDAMAAVEVPVFLLPGNHDPLDAASVYRARPFVDGCPPNVRVLADGVPVEVRPGVEVAGAPWTSKRPGTDLVAELADRLPPAGGALRIAVAHGAVDALSPDRDDPARIGLAAAEAAIAGGKLHYLALGDRHSVTRVADRIWYSGSPEATDFDEERPGRVLRVDLTPEGCEVAELQVGRWSFVKAERRLSGEADVEALAAWLDGLPDKTRTALRLGLVGELPLHARARLDEVLALAGERFAAAEPWLARTDLLTVPDALDRDELGLAGFAQEAFETLLAEARGTAGSGPSGTAAGSALGPAAGAPSEADPVVARDALTLLYRLARERG